MFFHVIIIHILKIYLYFNLATDVLKALKWSENLDETFKKNYEIDPRLSWQYFGSTTGFMRQFPGIYILPIYFNRRYII